MATSTQARSITTLASKVRCPGCGASMQVTCIAGDRAGINEGYETARLECSDFRCNPEVGAEPDISF